MTARGPVTTAMLGRRRQAPIQVGVPEIPRLRRANEPPATPTLDLARSDALSPHTALPLVRSPITPLRGQRRHYARPSDHPTQTPKVFSSLRGNDGRGSRIAIFVAFPTGGQSRGGSSGRDGTVYLLVSASNRPGHGLACVRVVAGLEAPCALRSTLPLASRQHSGHVAQTFRFDAVALLLAAFVFASELVFVVSSLRRFAVSISAVNEAPTVTVSFIVVMASTTFR
jgi:hypothetical protein